MEAQRFKICLFAGLLSCINLFAQSYSGGDGSELSPYLISSKTDMEAFAASVNGGNNYAGIYFLLTADLEGITTIIGTTLHAGGEKYFNGIFDGDGHIVNVNINALSGAIYTSINNGIGVFGIIDNAIIKNLGVSGTITSMSVENSGGICGIARNSIIANCYNSANIYCETAMSTRAGGICGYANKSTVIYSCYNTGNISTWARGSLSSSTSGGIVGLLQDSKVFACFTANDTIISRTSPTAVGRIVGSYGTFSIESCFARSSMLVNSIVLINQDANSKDGKNELLSSFRSQSWLEYNLLYIASGNRYYWDFQNVWTMSDISSTSQGLPILKNIHYPKKVLLSPQIGAVTAGTTGSAFYTITTENIVDHLYPVTLKGAPQGVSVPNTLIGANRGTITINTSKDTPAGTYPLTLIIDNTTSASFTLTVGGSVGINKIEKDNISLYLNPAKDLLFVSGLSHGSKLQITDIAGKQWLQYTSTSNTNTVDVNTLPHGIYVIRIVNGSTFKSFKIIK